MKAERQPAQHFALVIGVIFFLIGIMGFIPGLVLPPAVPDDTAYFSFTAGYGIYSDYSQLT